MLLSKSEDRLKSQFHVCLKSSKEALLHWNSEILPEPGVNHLAKLNYCIVQGFGSAILWTSVGHYLALNSTEKNVERNSSILWMWHTSG